MEEGRGGEGGERRGKRGEGWRGVREKRMGGGEREGGD